MRQWLGSRWTALFYRVRYSLAIKVLLITLALSVLLWWLIDWFQEGRLQETFLGELTQQLAISAQADRALFDQELNRHTTAAKLIIAQPKFTDYVSVREWQLPPLGKTAKRWERPPPWLPDPSVLRVFYSARYGLLLDHRDRVRELYSPPGEDIHQLDGLMAEPLDLLLKLSSSQSYLTTFSGRPFVVTARSLEANDQHLATLMLVSPIDGDFLADLHHSWDPGTVIALVDPKSYTVVASSNPEIPPGARLEQLRERYLVLGKSFFDYGASDLTLQMYSFLPIQGTLRLADQVLRQEARQRNLVAAVLITAFLLLALGGIRRILRLARRVAGFADTHLGTALKAPRRGDELDLLEHHFDVLCEGVHFRARAEQELKRSNAELEQFAYVASHDLRAPLRGIRNLAGWIQEDLAESLNDEVRENLGLLQARVRRMEQLIEGLLAYSRIGRVRSNLETLDSGALLAEIIDLVQAPAGFRIEVGEGLPVLETDRTQLQLVLQNLITNAIKHHDGTSGRIRVEALAEGDGYRFTVTDDGPGIPPQHRERVFQMFQTLRPRDEVEASGMGLALVRKAVEHAGGTITLDDAPGGRGARFSFTWPKRPPPRNNAS